MGCERLLMEHIEDIAKKQQIAMIELDYWTDNERAREFYGKNVQEEQRICI